MPESWASIGTICGTLLRFGWKWRGSVSGLFRMPWGHKSIAMKYAIHTLPRASCLTS